MLLDRLDAERAVAAAARQDDADGALALVVGEGAKKMSIGLRSRWAALTGRTWSRPLAMVSRVPGCRM